MSRDSGAPGSTTGSDFGLWIVLVVGLVLAIAR
jgi:hypothetical protein